MVGGGQIGSNPETRGWIAPHQQVTDPFGQGGAYGHKRGPFQQGFGDPSKLATNATLDINYRDHYPPMEQQQAAGDGAVVDQQRGNVYKQPEWGQESGGRVVESEYQVATGRDLSVSESSRSDGSEDEEEEEEDEDDEDDDDEDDEDMVENDDDDDKEGPEGVTDPQVVEGVSGVPLAHSGLEIRPEHAFPRNIAERDRATLKAAAIGTAGTSSNSPFGMFQSPSSTIPFLNSFSSPSNAAPHADGNPSQNGVVIASASTATASYSLTRDGDLSRDNVVTRESLAVVTTTTTSSLQEPSSRIVASGPPLHEQLQTTDVDNYYTTLLNTQTPPNNGINKAAAEAASRRMADPQSTAESSLRRILSDPLTGALMDDAMIISCGHSVGNAGRRRVMETSVCIICGASVRTEAMAPNYALRIVVQAFKREEEMNGNLSLRSAKRRRDTVQESIGLPEQAAADAAKVKGVQFPFVVSDRVMIKGNKRTPERFVGREAVITTQCLNGWYLVRTLDTGESVRLQYRSLQKVGGQTPSNDSEYRPS